MIKETDLLEAIAECEGQRNPNASTCIKLAAFYTIRRELFGTDSAEDVIRRGFSGAMAPESATALRIQEAAVDPSWSYDSGSDFSEAIKGKSIADCLAVLDEMMNTLQVLTPRLYDGVMRKLNEI